MTAPIGSFNREPLTAIRRTMEVDNDKIDEAALALLHLTWHDGYRVWKSFDWGAMNRLHEKGFIMNPARKAKSVGLPEDRLREAERFGFPLNACVNYQIRRNICWRSKLRGIKPNSD